jgi:hypothetical protein
MHLHRELVLEACSQIKLLARCNTIPSVILALLIQHIYCIYCIQRISASKAGFLSNNAEAVTDETR